MGFGCGPSGCIQNLPRRFLGNEVGKLFEQTGYKLTDELIAVIDGLLTKYREEIPSRYDSPTLIGKIFKEAKELYDKSKPESV